MDIRILNRVATGKSWMRGFEMVQNLGSLINVGITCKLNQQWRVTPGRKKYNNNMFGTLTNDTTPRLSPFSTGQLAREGEVSWLKSG